MNQQMLSDQSVLFAVGLNHRTAPLDVRERVYVQADEVPELIGILKKTLSEVVVLSTCNRTEIYGVTNRLDLGLDHYKDLLIDFKGARGLVTREHFFGSVACVACQQLFTVATSLDSKIIGDTQILGQMRDAYSLAKRHGSTGKVVNQLFQRSFKIGKKTRTETTIHKGAISVSVAAAEFAQRHLDNLKDKTVLLIGAGDTAKLAAEALIKRKVGKLVIANRTISHAEKLAADLDHPGIVTLGLTEIANVLLTADVIISSATTTRPLLHRSDLAGSSGDKLVIDLGMPRNVAAGVADLPHILLKNVDDLNEIVDENFKRRLANEPIARGIIQEEMKDFLVWYYSLPLLPARMTCGVKPDPALKREIVGAKQFLFDNLSWVHKAAMGADANTFEGHAAVVDKLVEMRNSAAAAR